MPEHPLPTFADVQAAASRLQNKMPQSPLLSFPQLDKQVGCRVLLKAELFQPVGSFKLRGAYNRLVQLSEAERARGVVAFSSGNHAQGVAWAAKQLGMKATIVMPEDAPQLKLKRTQALGAAVKRYNRQTESREALAQTLAEASGATLLPSFDDPDVIAGQGTAGLEAIDQATAKGLRFTHFVSCCGGGGLSAGIGLAFSGLSPKTQLFSAEPAGFDSLRQALRQGERVSLAQPAHTTRCDALMSLQTGAYPFAVHRQVGTVGLAVSEQEVAEAVAYAYHHLKLVLEPGGAAALAALLSNKLELTADSVVGLTLSGGNIDPETLMACLQQTS